MATQHLRLVVNGSYKAPRLAAERWQFGLRFRVSNSSSQPWGDLPTDVDWEAADASRDETDWTIEKTFTGVLPATGQFEPDDWLNDQVAPAVKAYFLQASTCHDTTRVDSLVAYGYTDGKVAQTPAGVAKTTLTFKAGKQPDGSATGVALPPETATCVTLLTGVSGRRGKGRIYLPMNSASNLSTDNDGYLKPATTSAMASAAAVFIESLNYTNVMGNVTVDAIVTGEPFTRYARVQGVRVGDVVDSQRRRRRQLVETYATANLP